MWWKIVLENLLPIVFALITPILLILIRGGIQAAAKKWKLDWALGYEARVEDLVKMGIAAAEKASLNAVKSGSPKTPGEQKLSDVIAFVNKELTDHDLPAKGGEALATLINAKLFNGTATPQPAPLPPAPPVI